MDVWGWHCTGAPGAVQPIQMGWGLWEEKYQRRGKDTPILPLKRHLGLSCLLPLHLQPPSLQTSSICIYLWGSGGTGVTPVHFEFWSSQIYRTSLPPHGTPRFARRKSQTGMNGGKEASEVLLSASQPLGISWEAFPARPGGSPGPALKKSGAWMQACGTWGRQQQLMSDVPKYCSRRAVPGNLPDWRPRLPKQREGLGNCYLSPSLER